MLSQQQQLAGSAGQGWTRGAPDRAPFLSQQACVLACPRRHAVPRRHTHSATQLHAQAPHGEDGSRCFIDGCPPPPMWKVPETCQVLDQHVPRAMYENVDGWMTETLLGTI